MLKLDYFWGMLCHRVFSFDSFGVSVWMGKQEANERGWQDYDFPTTSLRAHSHMGGSTYFYPILTNQMGWATKVTYPDVGFVLGWSCPTIRHACVLCWVYVLAIVCALLCMLQSGGSVFLTLGSTGMSVLCSVRLTRVPVLVRATNDWVWALCSLSSAEASAKFMSTLRIDTGPWEKKQT